MSSGGGACASGHRQGLPGQMSFWPKTSRSCRGDAGCCSCPAVQAVKVRSALAAGHGRFTPRETPKRLLSTGPKTALWLRNVACPWPPALRSSRLDFVGEGDKVEVANGLMKRLLRPIEESSTERGRRRPSCRPGHEMTSVLARAVLRVIGGEASARLRACRTHRRRRSLTPGESRGQGG